MKTTKIAPAKESKEYEIEVYVAFYKDGGIFVNAQEVGKINHIPTGDVVERYTFKVAMPNNFVQQEDI